MRPDAAVVGQIDLRDVAGDHHLGVEAEPREEHLHLLGGRVLRLIEDDEGIVQRAAAHVGEGSNLDGALLGQRRDLLGLEHVVEGIVQRPQIRMHLLDEIAREEAKTLTCLHGGTRQDDARDLALDESGHGHRHGEVGFARCPRGRWRSPGRGRGRRRDIASDSVSWA